MKVWRWVGTAGTFLIIASLLADKRPVYMGVSLFGIALVAISLIMDRRKEE